MCMICMQRPSADMLAQFDQHLASGKTATLSANGPESFFTLDQMADQLISGYWTAFSQSPANFDPAGSTVLTFDVTLLSSGAQDVARAALQAWSNVADITFVESTHPVGTATIFEDVDAPASTASSYRMAVGEYFEGTLTSGDIDYIGVNLVAGQTYTVALDGFGSQPLSDPTLRVYNPAGTQVAFNDDSGPGLNSHLTFTANTTGTFFLSAGAFTTSFGQDYRMFISEGAWSPTDILFDDAGTGSAYSISEVVGGFITQSTVIISEDWLSEPYSVNSYWFQTYVHEIGHALGLGHAGNYNGGAVWGVDNLYGNDSWQASVMSYFAQTDNPLIDASYAELVSVMPADIVAIQRLYGAPTNANSGNTVYGIGSNADGYMGPLLAAYASGNLSDPSLYNGAAMALTIYDGGGTDTMDFSGFSNNQRISLIDNTASNIGGLTGNVMIARGVTIENATSGAGNDTLVGNAAGNWLRGNAGADSLDGGAGSDQLWGGAGADVHNGGTGLDFARYDDANWGNLTIRLDNSALNTGAAAVGDTYIGIEGLVGGAGNDTIWGDGNANYLYGAGGVDHIRGGAGNDLLFGGADGDHLWGGAGADVHDGGNGGIDYARYDDADWGNLTLRLDNSALNTGAAAVGDTYVGIEGLVGGVGNDTIWGDGNANYLFGGGGVDHIRGGGGNDLMWGDAGGDHLWGGAGADAHYGGSGGIDYARYDDANWGNLFLNLGNAAQNTGAVAVGDTYVDIEGLVGGAGNDTILGDDNNNFLFGSGGDDMIRGGGGNDYLSGDAGADNLWGGAGADAHFGGSGIDYARYDDANWGDLTIRLDNSALNAGAAAVGDTYVGIEGLVGGAGNDIIFGDSGANFLFGSGGNDWIDGRGGADWLFGGAGADTFSFATNPVSEVIGRIADFQTGVDHILLYASLFNAIGSAFTADEFRVGAAQDGNDFILYDQGTGIISYDADGSASGAAMAFAAVSAGLALTYDDFLFA